jgi:hypothetical protein
MRWNDVYSDYFMAQGLQLSSQGLASRNITIEEADHDDLTYPNAQHSQSQGFSLLSMEYFVEV